MSGPHVLQGLLAQHGGLGRVWAGAAETAYEYADAMIDERNKERERR